MSNVVLCDGAGCNNIIKEKGAVRINCEVYKEGGAIIALRGHLCKTCFDKLLEGFEGEVAHYG